MFKQTLKLIGNSVMMLAAVAGCGYLAFDWSREQGIAELEQDASQRLEIAGALLFAPTDKYSYLPGIVAAHPVVIDTLLHKGNADRVKQANQYLERLNTTVQSAVIYILDERGVTVASSNWQDLQSFVGNNYGFRPYFQNALKHGTGTFYGMGTTSLLPGYYVSQVVRDGAAAIGVAVVKVDLSTLDERWKSNREEVTVTDEHGVIFLSSRPDWKYQPMRPLDPQALETLRRTRQYEAVLKDPLPMTILQRVRHDTQVVAVGAPEPIRYLLKSQVLAGSDWTINVLVPIAETETRAWRLAFIAGSTLVLVALTLMYLKQLSARVREREKSRLVLEQKHRELQQLSEELRLASVTDPLTGAHNRRFFFESVPKIVSAAKRHHFPLSIMTIDVDHFKRINDVHGHAAGDKALQIITALCKESLREADVFARFGGEEFIMALPNTDAETATRVAERLRAKVMERPLEIKDTALDITVSCGISQLREAEPGIEPALKRADEALYIAKKEGRNRVVVR